MITFLNFAPIEFMGGAERWMYETAKYVNKKEKTIVLSVGQSLANIYSQVVLGRNFEKRVILPNANLISLKISSFIPFTKNYKEINKIMNESRLIYIKFEIAELIILIYYGGFNILKKVIAGFHSPFYYQTPVSNIEKLHNYIYISRPIKNILSRVNKIHVLNIRDLEFLQHEFGLKKVINIPTSVRVKTSPKILTNNHKFKILFVGELSKRKGVDILLDIIKNAPKNDFQFDIVGNGAMENDVILASTCYNNCKYHGFLNSRKLSELYRSFDALILPSRAEGFPLVFHEAMANGLVILDSVNTQMGFPNYTEYTSSNNAPNEYISIIKKLKGNNKKNKVAKEKNRIIKYYKSHFEDSIIKKQLSKAIFA